MRLKTVFTLGFISFVVFVTAGDRFLPKPLSHASQHTRTSIDGFLTDISIEKMFFNTFKNTDKFLETEETKEKLGE